MSNALTIERTPGIIAIEINSIKDQTKKIILCSSLEIGHRLVEAKELVPHGEWGDWLEKQVDYSPRTANNLMQLYKEYGGSQMNLFGGTVESQAIANLTYTQAVALLGIPSHEREQFVQENDVENMSTRELQQAIKDRDELRRQLKEVEDTADQIVEERDKLLEAKREAEEEQKKLKSQLKENYKQLAEAKNSRSDGSITQLQGELAKTDTQLKEATKKIADLETQLKEKPIDVPATTIIEKVPEAMIKFKVRFDTLVGDFKDLLAILEEIKVVDPEAFDRYRGAVSALIGKMQGSL